MLLVKLATGGTGTLILITIGNLIIRMGSSIVLARLLEPSTFGLLNIIMSIFFTIVLLTDLGVQSHVVRHPDGNDPHFGNVVWTIHAARGVLIGLLSAALSPLAALLLDKPELTWPLAVASVTLSISGFASLSLFTVLKNGGGRRLSLFDFWLGIFQSAVTISLAWWLHDIWAFIISMILQNLVRTILSYVVFPPVGFKIARDRSIAREFLAFSRLVFVSSAMTLVIAQTDRLVLARLFTLAEFGLYGIGGNLASVPVAFVDAFVTRFIFPIYTHTWANDRANMRHVYRASGRAAALLYGLGCGGLIGVAPVLIHILYPAPYAGAALFLSILMISTALKLQTFFAAEVMTAIGKVQGTIYMNMTRLTWLIVAGLLGFIMFGAIGLISVVGLIEVPALFCGWFLLRRAGLLHIWREAEYLLTVLTGAAIGWIVRLIAANMGFI